LPVEQELNCRAGSHLFELVSQAIPDVDMLKAMRKAGSYALNVTHNFLLSYSRNQLFEEYSYLQSCQNQTEDPNVTRLEPGPYKIPISSVVWRVHLGIFLAAFLSL
jgi:hypothetical protein